MNIELDVSFDYCASIARRARSNFYYTFALLPTEKRRAMYAVYAYLRELDDIADGPMSLEWQALASKSLAAETIRLDSTTMAERLPFVRELPSSPLWSGLTLGALDLAQQHRLRRLETARQDFAAALAGEARGPILPALVETIRNYNIPREYFTAVMQGIAADIAGQEYATWQELREYCYRVASVVGLVCLHIWGFRDERAFPPAIACGLAFQLTNILRDLGEDAANGRIYLPRDEIAAAGYSESELTAGIVNPAYEHLLEQQLARAYELYAEAEELPRFLERDGQRIFAAMFATYRALLDAVSEQRDQLLQQRVRIGRWRKVWIAARALWQTRLGAPREPRATRV
jgi:15-cis-phytoene synthase